MSTNCVPRPDGPPCTEMLVPNAIEKLMKGYSKLLLSPDYWNVTVWRTFYHLGKETLEDMALQPLRNEDLEDFLKSGKKVDLVVSLMSHASFLADIFDCPIVLFSPIGPFSFGMAGTGIDINLSVQPSIRGTYLEPMTFLQRVRNHIQFRADLWIIEWIFNKVADHQRDKLETEMRRPMDIMRERFSLLISASHPVTHGAWPYPPNVIEVGSLHTRDPKPLPPELETFMNSDPRGVVLVSFGSAIKPSAMSEDQLSVLIDTFKRIELSVIWKWDADIENLPKNVKISPWVPQQDLLGHPNLKVFVTHGGMGSMMEAIYHKAAIVGIPLTNDQRPNLLRAVRHGYARMLEWGTITADDLTSAINNGIGDEKMRSSLERTHNLYKDMQQKPREKAAWWVEYVCRHKGAHTLQQPFAESIPWHQYHHVDIVAFVIPVISAICGVAILSCRICCHSCCKRKVKVD